MKSFPYAQLVFFILSIIIVNSESPNAIKYKLTLTQPNRKDSIIRFTPILNQLSLPIPTIKLCLGTAPQCFPFSLTFKTAFIYVLGYNYSSKLLAFYDKNQSVSYMGSSSRKDFPYQGITIRSQLVYDYISDAEEGGIKAFQAARCPFYMIIEEKSEVTPGEIAGGLGLRTNKLAQEKPKHHSEEDTIISYVNHLLLTHFISESSFTMNYNSVDGGSIEFGVKHNEKDLYYCNSRNGSSFQWICTFHQIQIGFISYNSNIAFTFDPSYSLISGPASIVRLLFEAIMSATSSQCSITHDNDVDVLTCSSDLQFKDLPDLSFIYAYYYFRVKMVDVFKLEEINGERMQVCLIIGTPWSEWILGLPAFNNRMLVFNEDKEEIGFISQETPIKPVEKPVDPLQPPKEPNQPTKENKDLISNKSNKGRQSLFTISIAVILSGIAMLAMVKAKYSDRRS